MSSCLFVTRLALGGPVGVGMAVRIISARTISAFIIVAFMIVAFMIVVLDITACATGWNGIAGQESASLHDVVFAAAGPSVGR